jgi:hypothetical protein
MNTKENLSDRKSGEAPPPRSDKQTITRQRPKRQPETNRRLSNNTPLENTTSYLHLVKIKENEITDYDQTAQHPSHYIPSKEEGSHRDKYNKPTDTPTRKNGCTHANRRRGRKKKQKENPWKTQPSTISSTQ